MQLGDGTMLSGSRAAHVMRACTGSLAVPTANNQHPNTCVTGGGMDSACCRLTFFRGARHRDVSGRLDGGTLHASHSLKLCKDAMEVTLMPEQCL